MVETREWPQPCFIGLLNYIEQNPQTTVANLRTIADIITNMPEAKTAGLAPSASAVRSKLLRYQKRFKRNITRPAGFDQQDCNHK